ncbi:hypothetical protein CK934_09495 [Chitinophaga sp. MD30]|nr:hypothetical protein CK934_09495 [Chitinophaga sp. MD30]
MCSKDDKAQPAPATIDKAKVIGTWSITKGLFNYYDGNEKLIRQNGIEKNGLNGDLWDHSTLEAKDSTFTQTGIVAQDHLPRKGKWQIVDEGRTLRTIDGGNSQRTTDWEVVSYAGSVLTIRLREARNNGEEKIAEALLELTKE